MKRGKKPIPPQERFSRLFERGAPDECWLWNGSKRKNGYGWFNKGLPDGSILAHRMAFELFHGEVPHGMMVLHSCDNRLCVNPAHLSAGTGFENTRQAWERRRFTHNKLSADDVIEIRTTKTNAATLAAQMGVTRDHVRDVRSGKCGHGILQQLRV